MSDKVAAAEAYGAATCQTKEPDSLSAALEGMIAQGSGTEVEKTSWSKIRPQFR